MNESEYHRLRDRLRAEYESNLAALDRVFALSQALGVSIESKTQEAEVVRAHREEIRPQQTNSISILRPTLDAPRGAVLKAVEDTVGDMADGFSWIDVFRRMKSQNFGGGLKSQSVRQAVTRLATIGKLEVIELGKGRAPTKFRVNRTGE